MTAVHRLSKSRLISGWQCALRLWQEVYEPGRAEVADQAEWAFATGHEVGAAAQGQFPEGVLIGHDEELEKALQETEARLRQPGPTTLFEATFRHDDVLIRADILQRDAVGNVPGDVPDHYRIVEVKAATSVKEYYIIDCAIQLYVLQGALGDSAEIRIELAHINNRFVYQGDGDYTDLFTYVDVTQPAEAWLPRVPQLIGEMRTVLGDVEPIIETGRQCTHPFDCPFIGHCAPQTTDYPIASLPGSRAVKTRLRADGFEDIRDIPAGTLTNVTQERVRRVTKTGRFELDPAAAKVLHSLPYPRYYLDFETASFAVPIWQGTRPYQAYPFQWSCHIEMAGGQLEHCEFLPKGRWPPMRVFTESLIRALGQGDEPIFVYTAYEKKILTALQQRFEDLTAPIDAIIARLFDLHPLTKANYYHPDMHGSWSIKAILPTIAPDLSYASVGEISEGMQAGVAYRRLLGDDLTEERQAEIKRALKAYCELDTLAMVRLVRFLTA